MHMAPRAIFFFFNDTATTEIYTLSLHDALPICDPPGASAHVATRRPDGHRISDEQEVPDRRDAREDRKSTRLNSSHSQISYAVFCLKKKNLHDPWLSPTRQPRPQYETCWHRLRR